MIFWSDNSVKGCVSVLDLSLNNITSEYDKGEPAENVSNDKENDNEEDGNEEDGKADAKLKKKRSLKQLERSDAASSQAALEILVISHPPPGVCQHHLNSL